MSLIDDILLEMLRATKASKEAMAEARNRRDIVFEAVMTYEGALRTIKSGSVAHGTVSNYSCKVDDADGSLVLNRQVYTAYGPDGENLGPCMLVEDIAEDLRELVSQVYPNVWISTRKHAIFFRFREPMPDGQDPTVDLVISLNRKNAPGLWIPHLHKDIWDAADPERHTEMVRAKRKDTKGVSTRVVRAAKLFGKQWDTPLLSSFHFTALMLASMDKKDTISHGLLKVLRYGAADLQRRNTPDPAEISEPLKVPGAHSKDKVIAKLGKAADRLDAAIALQDAEDAEYNAILEYLRKIFWKSEALEVLDIAAEKVKVERSVARATRNQSSVSIAVGATGSYRPVTNARAYSDAAATVLDTALLPAWHLDERERHHFERELKGSGYTPLWEGMVGRQYVYKIPITIPGYGISSVAHIEVGADTIRVFAPGYTALRHVNGDGSLCIWYPPDVSRRRWQYKDGLVVLLDMIALHLFKELRFKETGTWPGEEVH